MRFAGLVGGVSSCLLAALPVTVQAASIEAQGSFQRNRNTSVRDRPRPEYDALGLRAGSFLVFPKAELTQGYEDNLFAAETNGTDDAVTSFVPSVSAESQWSRHALRAQLQANIFQYWKNTNQNNSSYSATTSGRLDVVRGTSVTGGLSYQHLVEPRTSASSPFDARDPVEFDATGADAGFTREVNRLRISGGVHYRGYRFKDVRSVGGPIINQSYRDNDSWEESARIDYAISPALAIYATGLHNSWSFKDPARPGDRDRDANGYQVAAGADFELTNLIRGQVQAGYLKQNFKDPLVADSTGLALLGQVEYFPTQLLTVRVNVERTVQATGVFGAAGIVHGALGGQADYELLRNLIVTARAQRVWDKYNGLDREDDIWTATLGLNYLVNRRLGVNFAYNFYDQNSSGALRGRIFDANKVQLGVVVQY